MKVFLLTIQVDPPSFYICFVRDDNDYSFDVSDSHNDKSPTNTVIMKIEVGISICNFLVNTDPQHAFETFDVPQLQNKGRENSEKG